MSMSIVKAVYDYILTCPLLKEFKPGIIMLNVDYSNGQQVTSYSISEVPCNPILNTYVNGNTENQFQFTLCSVESFGEDSDQNILNIAFYDQFSNWIRENNKIKNFPVMDEKQKPFSIQTLTGGTMLDNQTDMSAARYVISCQLKYNQKN